VPHTHIQPQLSASIESEASSLGQTSDLVAETSSAKMDKDESLDLTGQIGF